MSETSILLQVIGAGLIALGLLSMLVGFFRALFRARQEDGGGVAFFGLGAAALVAGVWMMQRG